MKGLHYFTTHYDVVGLARVGDEKLLDDVSIASACAKAFIAILVEPRNKLHYLAIHQVLPELFHVVLLYVFPIQ